MTGAGASPDRVDLFEADIAGSGEALARLLDAWQPVDLGARSRIAFTGLGSSRFAALIVASALRARGKAAWVEYASTRSPTAPADDLALVAISASGRTPEVLASAKRHKGTSLVVAVTNDPTSRLAETSDVVIPLHAGIEHSGIAWRSFRATIAALALLTGMATPADLRAVLGSIAALQVVGDEGSRPTPFARWSDALEGVPAIDVLADSSLLGMAEQAALMLREAPRSAATAYDTGDWLHTGVYLAVPGHRVLLYPGADADREVVQTVRRRGGEVVAAEPDASDARSGEPDRDPVRRAIVDSLLAERLAVALWRRATASDVSAGRSTDG
jgi:fructoselysine-6-P-deglycase FrlB-like protein